MKGKFSKLPWLPISALLFYLSIIGLWQLGVVPSPAGIVDFLESLYESYGLLGLFFASFLESLVYIGLYFPGSFVIVLAVFLSDGHPWSLLSISLVVAAALTITATINYTIGRSISNKDDLDTKHTKKGLFLSMLYPNALAFYFFNSGIKKGNPLRILLVPIIMIPYGFLLAVILYPFRESLRTAIESPLIMISAITVWLIIAILINMHHERKKS